MSWVKYKRDERTKDKVSEIARYKARLSIVRSRATDDRPWERSSGQSRFRQRTRTGRLAKKPLPDRERFFAECTKQLAGPVRQKTSPSQGEVFAEGARTIQVKRKKNYKL